MLAACGGADSPVRKVVFRSSAHYYGCERDDPAYFTEDDAPPAPAADADRGGHRRGRARRRGVRRAQPAVTVTVLRFANALGPDIATSHSALLALPVVPRSSASTPATSSSTRTTSPACSSTPRGRTCRAPTTPPATGCSRSRRSRRCSASRSPRSCRRRDRARRRGAAARRREASRPRCSSSCATGARIDNRRLKAAGVAFRATTARDRAGVRRAPPRAQPAPRRGRGVPVRARRRGVPALEPGRAGGGPARLEQLSRDQLAELARALEALPRPARLAPRGRPARPRSHRLALPSGGAADAELAADP